MSGATAIADDVLLSSPTTADLRSTIEMDRDEYLVTIMWHNFEYVAWQDERVDLFATKELWRLVSIDLTLSAEVRMYANQRLNEIAPRWMYVEGRCVFLQNEVARLLSLVDQCNRRLNEL